MPKISIIILLALLMIPLSYSIANLNADYLISNNNLIINIDGESYLNIIEIYKGPFRAEVKPEDVFLSAITLNCVNTCSGKTTVSKSLDEIKIFEPGDYYFVVKDVKEEAKRVDFNLNAKDMLVCEYNNKYIKNRRCVYEFTNNLSDKSLYCSNKKIIDRCLECGCSDNKLICCTNENLNECKGNLGKCIKASEGRIEKKITVEANVTNGTIVTETVGCSYFDINIPDGICLNSVSEIGLQRLMPKEDSSLFAGLCSCKLQGEDVFDKDGDRYDSMSYKGGTDCDDNNARVNPGMKESCEDETGYDGLDNNCDGKKDLDCKSYCDKDGDGYTPNFVCRLMGYKLGDCDDTNLNINPGKNEICDGIDNNCNGLIDEINCECRMGQKRTGNGICIKGKQFCNELGKWIDDINDPPVNSCDPSITVNGFDAGGNIDVLGGNEFSVKTKFVCQELDGCGDVEVSVK